MNELRIICADCGREFKNMKSGVLVKELFQKNKEVYRVWNGDRLGCPECGKTLVARFADKPIAEHWNKEKMTEVLVRCEKKTLGFDLFEWKEHVQVYTAPTTVTKIKKKRRGGCEQPH